MTTENHKQWAQVGEALPGQYADNATAPLRCTPRGEQIVEQINGAILVNEGSYFIVTNPTPGTGIAGIAAANGYDATEALCTIRNSHASKKLVLDHIKLQPTAAGASGTTCTFALHKDKGNSRWASGGTAYTPVNANLESDLVSGADVHFGALVTDAATADVVKLSSGTLRPVILVVGDEVLFDFTGKHASTSALFEGTLVCKQAVHQPPVVLNPGEELILAINAASQSGASSFEFEIGFYLR